MNILHLESYNYSEKSLNILRGIGDLKCLKVKNENDLIEHLSANSYQAIFTTIGFSMNEHTLKSQYDLKYIITPTTGLNHIDLKFAYKKGIEVISLKGELEFLKSVKSTAEHTWTLLLSLVRQLPQASESVKNESWNRFNLLCDELNTKTIGVIGYGRLGEIICEYAKVFGMHILVCEINEKRREVAKQKGLSVVSLSELLKNSDSILLMISYSYENENMIGTNEFAMMKEGAYFINTSRGEMVDEKVLLEALETKRIKGAGLDVLRNDSEWKNSIPDNHPLIMYAQKHSNLIITPHIGGYGKVSIALTRDFITQKFLKQIKK